MLIKKRHDRNFNPRSRVGSDAILQYLAEDDDNFNPRSRVGSDRPESST